MPPFIGGRSIISPITAEYDSRRARSNWSESHERETELGLTDHAGAICSRLHRDLKNVSECIRHTWRCLDPKVSSGLRPPERGRVAKQRDRCTTQGAH